MRITKVDYRKTGRPQCSVYYFLIVIPIFLRSCQQTEGFQSLPKTVNRRKWNWRIASSVSDVETDVNADVNVNVEPEDGWEILSGNVCDCLIKSDLKRLGGGDGGGSTGWTSWVDNESALRLQSCMNLLQLKTFQEDERSELRDEALSFTRWMKATPSPLRIDLSSYLRDSADITQEELESIQSETKEEFHQRLGLELLLLPSGGTLPQHIRTPPGALVYGTLLYGGAKRYRILPGKMQRRTGERTSILPMDSDKQRENFRAWLQYGGPERNYESVDIGTSTFSQNHSTH